MTPRDRYRAHIKRWAAVRAAASARAIALSRLRLVSFFAAVILLVIGVRGGYPWITAAAVTGFVLFAYLVVRHARVLAEIDRAEAGIAVGGEGLARLARDWNALPDIAPPPNLPLDSHPYARDLDLYGHASLAKWLGRTATRDGALTLASWLLTPADADAIRARQGAVEELARKHEWRESMGIEGRLYDAAPGDLARFLEWAEDATPIVPPFLNPLVIALVSMTWILLAWWLAGAVTRLPPMTADNAGLWFADAFRNGWWWIPVAINSILSRWMNRRIGAVFDRALLGQHVLERHAEMLGLVCDVPWQAARLAALQSTMRAGGDAPALVRRLARLGAWSELRSGVPLLYGPVQAFTLWDFHVLFGLERWRAVAGRHVRGWLNALGEIDALAVLSIPRADEPGWTMPSVDRAVHELSGAGLGHPLIPDDQRVPNDVHVGPPGTLLFVTGSNMSGKSTLLRAIGLNVVLAQAGAPVCAKSFTMPPVSLYTSIRVEDSLELGISYFMAALARLKQIVDAAERDSGGRLLYLLDEILQGTNSVERALAVRAVARHLLKAGAIGAMTSHDLTLAHEEPIASAATLVHFTEQVHSDGTMSFDYRLRPGLATSRNAIRLMQLIGITPE